MSAPAPPVEDKLEDVLVTPDFDVQPTLQTEYYAHLDQRLGELQNLLGAQGAALPSTYEKYLHGNVPAGATGNPLVSAKEYYEQLKQLRADSQVRRGAPRRAWAPPPAWQAARPAGDAAVQRLLLSRLLTAPALFASTRPSSTRPPIYPPPLLPPRLPLPQVYYPVAPEVYRDLLWEDVDVADPVEYTFCRYTPITTEVRRHKTVKLFYLACRGAPGAPQRLAQPAPELDRALPGPAVRRCLADIAASRRRLPSLACPPRPRASRPLPLSGRARLWQRRLQPARAAQVQPPHQAAHLRHPLQRGPGDAGQDAAGNMRGGAEARRWLGGG